MMHGQTSATLPIRAADFDKVRKLAHSVFGLDLRNGKEALVSARLSKRVHDLGLQDIPQYLRTVEEDGTGAELACLIDALTTNFTSFLREPRHFEILRSRILPDLAALAQFQIWSAGCSTGEEPYSILFTIADHLGERSIPRLKLIATDISTRALGAARNGVYPLERIKEMPSTWPRLYFQRGCGTQNGFIRVRPEWREKITFDRLNLMEDLTRVPRSHVIFCRNVMIYFDKHTQEQLIRRFAERLEPGGWLLIGHSEGLMGVHHELEFVQPAVYRRPPLRQAR